MPLPSVFQGVQEFKTALCPASNPPNPSAGLQGNNYSSHMPLPSVFQGVQDCRLPGLNRSKPFRRPPRQQLLQLHAPAICFSGGSRLPSARPQSLQTLPQASKATTLTATWPFRRPPRQQLLQLHAPAVCFSRGSRLPFARPQTHLFFRGFKTAVSPASNAPNLRRHCRLPGLKRSKPFRRPPRQQLLQLDAPAICFSGGSRVQDCRLPGLKPSKPFRRPPRQQLLQLHAPAICFSAGSRLPFDRPQTLQTLPQASKATTLTARCPCHLFFRGFKSSRLPFARPQTLQTLPQASKATTLTATWPWRRPPRQQLLQLHAPAVCFSRGPRLPFARPQTHLFFRGFKTSVCPASNAPNLCRHCRLPGLKRSKPFRRPPRQQLLQLDAPAICFSAGSRLPFARPQTLQTLPQASKATTLTATCPCQLFFRGFKTAVCPASNPPNPSAGLQGNNSYSYMPLPSVFQRVQDCRLPGLKPSKPFRRPPRQQLLQLHAPAICFSAGSRLPFARPQTLQTLPQAPKATTLTARCPCHLFFRGFKSSRLPFARPQTLQTLPQAYKATTLTARCPCHLFFRGFKSSRLPFARPQTLQTLPQASKATTLTAILYTGRSIGKERSTWSQLSRTEPSFTRKSGT